MPDQRMDHHDPTGGVGGAAPAASALTLRLWLASFGLIVAIAGTAAAAALGASVIFVVLLAAIAVTAVIDISVIVRRKRQGEPG